MEPSKETEEKVTGSQEIAVINKPPWMRVLFESPDEKPAGEEDKPRSTSEFIPVEA
jgi:hypothetical protein